MQADQSPDNGTFDQKSLLEKTARAIIKGEEAAKRCNRLFKQVENALVKIVPTKKPMDGLYPIVGVFSAGRYIPLRRVSPVNRQENGQKFMLLWGFSSQNGGYCY